MDEIGRGTSTFDGMSLAYACAEHLGTRNRALCLFSTHYFELTRLAEKVAGIENIHLDAIEHEGKIVFLHMIANATARLKELETGAEQYHHSTADTKHETSNRANTPDKPRSTSDTAESDGNSKFPSATVEIASVDHHGQLTNDVSTVCKVHDAVSAKSTETMPPQLDLFATADTIILQELYTVLEETDPDQLTPRDALNLIYSIKSRIES